MNSSNTPRLIAVIAVILVGGGALAYALLGGKKTDTAPTTETTPSTPTETSQTTSSDSTATNPGTSSGSTYKDGTYTATGTYLSPGGDERLGVTVTLKNDVITSASVSPMPVSHDGARFQAVFAANFKQYVVGKKIEDVHLTAVSGSSLTPEGFNDALAQIETQAKS